MKTKTNKNLKKFVALGLGLSLLASIGIGAYLTDTDTKSDVYTVGNVQAEIIANGDMEVANAGYLLPGTTHVYERAASNVGINDAYVFMSVTIPYETIGVADDNGTQLGEKVMQLFTPGTINSEWKLVDDGFIGEYAIAANGQAAGEHDTHSVIAGDTITYVYGFIGDNADGSLKALASGETTSNLVEEMKLTNLYNASKITGEVSTKLYAIQSNHVNGGLTDVNGVWAVINTALVGEDEVIARHTLITGIDFFKSVPNNVTSIEFISSDTLGADAFDVSEAQDGSVMAWVEDTTMYVTTIDGGVIVANPDSSYMFRRNGQKSSLTHIGFDNIDFSEVVNSRQMFSWNLDGYTSMVLPSSIKEIGYGMFADNFKLETITIHENITLIDEMAFANCTSLRTINYTGTEDQWNAITFGTNWNSGLPSDYVINFNHVPEN